MNQNPCGEKDLYTVTMEFTRTLWNEHWSVFALQIKGLIHYEFIYSCDC